eukprot:2225780-Rhodomonas_salina.1
MPHAALAVCVRVGERERERERKQGAVDFGRHLRSVLVLLLTLRAERSLPAHCDPTLPYLTPPDAASLPHLIFRAHLCSQWGS